MFGANKSRGTPVIDPATDTMYFFSKSYKDGSATGARGVYNGIYRLYGVNVNTFENVAGYPVLVDGVVADNDPGQYFVGGVTLQRPSLTLINNVVYGGMYTIKP